MLVNILIVLFIAFYGLHLNIYKKDPNQFRLKYIKIISVILIFQSALRNVAVGPDTYAYFLKYEEVKNLNWDQIFLILKDYFIDGIGKDPGYTVFQKLCQIFIYDYQLFLLLIAVIFFTALGNFIYKNTNRLNDAIIAFLIYSALYYSFFSITGHRQTIATAATLLAFELIKKNKWLSFIIIISIAATIHKSCLLFLPFYLVRYINKPEYILKIVLVLLPILFFSMNSLVSFFIQISGYDSYEHDESAGAITFTFMFLIIYIASIIQSKTLLKMNKNAKYYLSAFSIALIFVPLTWYNPNIMRVVQYFSIFMLLLIPDLLESFRLYGYKIRRDVFVFSAIIMILFTYKTTSKIPYGFFWQEMELGDNYKNNE